MKLKDKFKIMTYNVGIIPHNADEVINNGINNGDIIWMKHSYKDRFFADPFLAKEDDKFYYILCEEYIFWELKGKITLLKVKKQNFELESKKVIIEEPWHLSFPYIYQNEYIIPESHRGGKAYMYHLNMDSWTIDSRKVICEENGFNDPVFVNDNNGNEVLLSSNNLSDKLFSYEKNEEGLYKQKNKKPLLEDKSKTRPAGHVFEYNGDKIIPVQDCVERYGRQTRLEKIASLGDNEYKIEELAILNSDKNPPYDETMHTFNVYDGFIIVDGSKDFVRFPMKIVYKIMSKFRRK